jgi:hypothetical protein
MSVQHVPPPRLVLERLLTPGIRLGWAFRDRHALAAPFPEPEPDPGHVQRQSAERAVAAQARYARARRWVIKPALVLGLVLLLLAGYANGTHRAAAAWAALAAAVIMSGYGLGYTIRCWWRQARTAATTPERSYHRALAAWQRRAAAHQDAELARLGEVPEWSVVPPPALRTDVFGGSLRGWQSLLITHGTSILAAGPLLVMDLSGHQASGELTSAARAAQLPAAQYSLPADLARCGLLSYLSPAQFADALTEAIHAGTPGGARTDRAVDVRVLERLAAALDGRVTPARLAAAAQAALGHPVPPGLLAAGEEALIVGDLFPAEYRRQIGPNLVRLDAFLADLALYAGHPQPAPPPAPAYYTCLAMDARARSARGEMLTALSVQWLTVLVSASPASAPAVIIAGADEITRPHLERLAGACERRGVPLTVLFRHLREDALQFLGGGTAAFMRLGNHAEADQAASYIGRQHKFVLSQRTATMGGNQTLTRTDTDGYGDTATSSRSWQELHLGRGTRSRGTSTSWNWSTAQSLADGTSWSDATTIQRVYEYAVEPTVLQNLPDHALLLAAPGPADPRLQAVECDPAIAALPGLSARPLDPAAQVSTAQLPSAGHADWPTSPVWPPGSARLPNVPIPQAPGRPPGRHRA